VMPKQSDRPTKPPTADKTKTDAVKAKVAAERAKLPADDTAREVALRRLARKAGKSRAAFNQWPDGIKASPKPGP